MMVGFEFTSLSVEIRCWTCFFFFFFLLIVVVKINPLLNVWFDMKVL